MLTGKLAGSGIKSRGAHKGMNFSLSRGQKPGYS